MAGLTRRALLLGTGAVLGALGYRAISPALPGLAGVAPLAGIPAEGRLNDASGLSDTPIFRHITLSDDPGAALVAALRAELKAAAAAGRAVNIGAARHSMGGQAIPRDGHAITLQSDYLEIDSAARTFRAQAGVRWASVIDQLYAIGFSPKVMQSNNDFGVAATFSVNAHGWAVPHGPMGATVRSVDMVMADGTLVTASRSENAGLFGAAMGGYGLFGLITALEVEMLPNQRLTPSFTELPAADFAKAFMAAVKDPAVSMAYGRLNVDRARFFQDALLVSYRAAPDQTDLPAASGSGFVSKVSRSIFRAQLGNEPVKRWRWGIETSVAPAIAGDATRNSLFNEPVITLDDRDPLRTDILHEYFVSPDAFADFTKACADLIPASYQELLNVTLRYVAADPTSMLAYAPLPRIAAVLLFSQEMTARAEADMARMTQRLIDRVLSISGSYYLPYRPHATQVQFTTAYPKAVDAAATKRRLDPQLVLRNGFWDNYLEKL